VIKVLLNVRWPVGGIRTYLRYVYRHFSSARFLFTILAPPLAELDVVKDDLGNRVESFIECDPEIIKFTRTIIRLLRSRKFDIVHSHGLTAGLLANVPAKLIGVPHLLTLHDVFLDEQFKGLNGIVRRWVINMGLPMADSIHVLGTDPKNNLVEFFPRCAEKSCNVVIVRSGIEIERFFNITGDQDQALRVDHNIPSDRKTIGFFGRFMAQKGFNILVDAIEQLLSEKNGMIVPVVVVCGGGGYFNRDIRMLRQRGLDKHFRFLPFVPDISTIMSQLDGVVMPSRWETVGLVALEALVAGVPLLSSDCIGLREVTADTPTFSFKSNSSIDLANKIRSWNRDTRKKDFQSFVQEATTRFDVSQTANGIRKLYETMVGNV